MARVIVMSRMQRELGDWVQIALKEKILLPLPMSPDNQYLSLMALP